MRVCVWTTSLQADTLALVIAMDRDPEIELLVVAANLDAYRNEPIARFCPLNCILIDRSAPDHEARVKQFGADVFFADNHLPKFPVADKLVFFWHGLPLKIQPGRDIRSFHRYCKRLVGNPSKPNSRFLAQCYGRMDYNHRIKHWKIAKENCRIWGSAYSDLLIDPPYQRRDLEDYYDLELTGRKNILLSLTWNFGTKAFGVLGDDDEIYRRLLSTAEDFDANIIFSLHDRYRYHPQLIEKIENYAKNYPRSYIKYKNEHADNLADLVVSDVMICNFSSFIVFHYFTGKPSIHILPVDRSKRFVALPTMRKGAVRSIFRRNNHNLWIYPFEDNGGSMPVSADGLIGDINKSLQDESYCSENARRFIADRIVDVDGNSCNRIISDIKDWV